MAQHAGNHGPDTGRGLAGLLVGCGVAIFVTGVALMTYVLSANHPDSPAVGPGAAEKVKYALEVGPLIVIASVLTVWLGLWLRRRD
jgi:hypothetical protein